MENITIRSLLEQVNKLQYQISNIKSSVDEVLKSVVDVKSHSESMSESLSKDLLSKNDSYSELFKLLYDDIVSVGNKLRSELLSLFTTIKEDLFYRIKCLDTEHTLRDTQIYNTINSLSDRINKIHIDIINNDDNVTLTYTDHRGKIEYGSILKVRADNQTLTQDTNGVISVKYKFDNNSFVNENDVIIPTKIRTGSGEYISADYIKNDLGNATYNIESLTHKVERLLKQLSTSNGYIASNNFKSSSPNQDKLTSFVIECLGSSINNVTKELIPSGTKVKNTFDNHIWVFNRITHQGLTTYKWEDFGSDNICIASNDGVHGLVTGSNERFEGHIDMKGVITINGLREDIESLVLNALLINNIVSEYTSRIGELEEEIRRIKEGK